MDKELEKSLKVTACGRLYLENPERYSVDQWLENRWKIMQSLENQKIESLKEPQRLELLAIDVILQMLSEAETDKK